MSLAKELLEISMNSVPNLAQAEFDYICKRMRKCAEEGVTDYEYHMEPNKAHAAEQIIAKLEAEGFTVVKEGAGRYTRMSISWGAQ